MICTCTCISKSTHTPFLYLVDTVHVVLLCISFISFFLHSNSVVSIDRRLNLATSFNEANNWSRVGSSPLCMYLIKGLAWGRKGERGGRERRGEGGSGEGREGERGGRERGEGGRERGEGERGGREREKENRGREWREREGQHDNLSFSLSSPVVGWIRVSVCSQRSQRIGRTVSWGWAPRETRTIWPPFRPSCW